MTSRSRRYFENATYLERNGAGAERVAGLYFGWFGLIGLSPGRSSQARRVARSRRSTRRLLCSRARSGRSPSWNNIPPFSRKEPGGSSANLIIMDSRRHDPTLF